MNEIESFEGQALVLEETRRERRQLMDNLAELKKKVKEYTKEIEGLNFKELNTTNKNRYNMLINLTKLQLQIVDSELKCVNSSVDSEIAYKSLLLEVLKLKEVLENENKAKQIVKRPKGNPYTSNKSGRE